MDNATFDKLLEEFMSKERWEKAIDTAEEKELNKALIKRIIEDVDYRASICYLVAQGRYIIAPPRMQLIPKDNGKFRTVYINEDLDRIILSMINDILFDLCPDWISVHCTSYKKGIGTGKVAIEVAKWTCKTKGRVRGWKEDMTKYFDSVPIREIDKVFDKLRKRFGQSPILDILQRYYHQDLCWDLEGKLIHHYQSLKQGCATASFFADVLLYHVDEEVSKLGHYVRYCDDMLFIGRNHKKAKALLERELAKMGLSLNEKKTEKIRKDRWVTFLGFSIKGSMISLSKKRLKNLQKEVRSRIFGAKSLEGAVNSLKKYLYKGYGKEGYCWATSVLTVVNSMRDIELIDEWILDCFKAKVTGNKKIGGLGYEHHEDGIVTRGPGRNVDTNKRKVAWIDGWYTLKCMRNNLIYDRAVFRAIAA